VKVRKEKFIWRDEGAVLGSTLTNRSARVGGVNHTTNVICNPLYTIYFTTAKKDRLSVVKGLQNGRELKFILNPLTVRIAGKLPTTHQMEEFSNTLAPRNCVE